MAGREDRDALVPISIVSCANAKEWHSWVVLLQQHGFNPLLLFDTSSSTIVDHCLSAW